MNQTILRSDLYHNLKKKKTVYIQRSILSQSSNQWIKNHGFVCLLPHHLKEENFKKLASSTIQSCPFCNVHQCHHQISQVKNKSKTQIPAKGAIWTSHENSICHVLHICFVSKHFRVRKATINDGTDPSFFKCII